MALRISLAGDLGSGKSTVAKMLSEKYGVPIIATGAKLREIASRLGVTIERLNIDMEKDPSFAKELDDYLASFDHKEGEYIFDSRMAWYFVPSAVSFYLKTSPEVGAKRIFDAKRNDESFTTPKEAYLSLASRRASEAKRYLAYYGQDMTDMSNYDKVIDTTDLSPEQVVSEIERFLQKDRL